MAALRTQLEVDEALDVGADAHNVPIGNAPNAGPVINVTAPAPSTETEDRQSTPARNIWDLAANSAIARFQKKPDVDELNRAKKHRKILAFEHKIGMPEFAETIKMSPIELYNDLFLENCPYDHVCIARGHWQEMNNVPWNIGTFYTRAEFHLWLYAYTLKRNAAMAILVSHGCKSDDRVIVPSKTDDAFAIIIEALVHNVDDAANFIADFPQRARPRTVMITNARLQKAIRIVKELPMMFHVIGEGGGEQRTAQFWFVDKTADEGASGKVTGWDMEWVMMKTEELGADSESKYHIEEKSTSW